ncbi:hypothetical protein ACFSC6_03960 [Rufibacter sediminis]|uniref:O-fucosyltransferase family protein n=1 Tax=Rufibacter sediminis TaxID=2762756 RepID=A0ABR6VWC5_9BACT|nr:hypothetical protein [Rufibacter sediminis]MBC3541224.1 hypothetical protein [Rufibacter sediminis]
METNAIILCFYLKSATPIHTQTLPAHDSRLPQLLEDVRMVRHGNYVFVHLRSDYEWERAQYFLNKTKHPARLASSSAA